MNQLLLSSETLTILEIESRQNFCKPIIIQTYENDSVNDSVDKCSFCEKYFSKLSSLSIHLNDCRRKIVSVNLRTEQNRAQNRLRVQRYRLKVKNSDEEVKSVRQSLQDWTKEEKIERKKELARRRIKKYRSLRKNLIKTKETTEEKLYKIERFRQQNRFRVARHRARVRAETEKEAILIEIGLIQPKNQEKDNRPSNIRATKHKSLESHKLFICVICGKTLKNPHSLKFHENIHEVERFKREELKNHFQITHRNYICFICGNEYKYKSSLRTHSKLHQNTKTFQLIDSLPSLQHTRSTVDFSCLGLI